MVHSFEHVRRMVQLPHSCCISLDNYIRLIIGRLIPGGKGDKDKMLLQFMNITNPVASHSKLQLQ